ncbi:MAG: modulated sigma54 specific transcriptional regulator, Fis family [Pelosinus sp.]|jgi:transcriptional regulator with PAS, ATPase and Fis domain|nr:modulated sigma54 specific transcriptional regulator, Fis family [Pelosinus sp.]
MQKAIIGHEEGLSAKFTALVVQKAYQLQRKYKTNLFIHYKNYREISCTHFGLIVDVNVKKGEILYISSKDQESIDARYEMVTFLESGGPGDLVQGNAAGFSDQEIHEEEKLMLEMLHDGVAILNQEGCIVFVNTSFASLAQQSFEQLIGKYINDIIPTTWAKGNLQGKRETVGNIICVDTVEAMVVSVKSIPVNGTAARYIVVVRDEREIKCLKEKLEILKLKTVNLQNLLSKEKEASWHPHRWVGESSEQKFIRTMKFGSAFEKFIGMNETVLDAIALAAKAAKVQSTVLIIGKSGTGKEVVAEGIHLASPRVKGPFIKVNCAAIPMNLLESELFGHERGAFTGAFKKKLGKFELAHEGTIFLDEIGEMDLSMQTKLLRVLQTSSFERVGGEETIAVNVRIVAATNRDLEAMVKEGRFREDLYYRLNVIPVLLPSLKERKDDIPLLVDYFLKKFNKDFGKEIQGIKKSTMDALIGYDWPGNVRELKNIIERFVALADSEYIELSDLPLSIRQNANASYDNSIGPISTSIIQGDVFLLEEYEKQIITAALDKYGSYTAAGKVLGITHKTVAAKAQKYGIDKKIHNG